MPKWVIDKSLFKRAVGLFIKNHGRKPKTNNDWGIISGIYKKLGGRVRKSKDSKECVAENIFNYFKETYVKIVLNDLYEEYVKE